MPSPTRLSSGIVGLASGLASVSALLVIAIALASSGTKPWFLIGFELVALVSGVFGVLIAAGRMRDGIALGLACVAGALFATGYLGYLSAGKQLAGYSILPLTLGRFAAAACILLVAGWAVLARNPKRSTPEFLRGALWLGAFAALAVVMYIALPWMRGLGLPGPILALAGIIIALVLLGLFAAGMHKVVRAFECGRVNS